MVDDASLPTTRWSGMDHNPSVLFGIGRIEANGGFAASTEADRVVHPYRRHPYPRSTLDWPIAPRLLRPRGGGRIEEMMMDSQKLPRPRSCMLGVLLEAADPERCGGSSTLKPLWANEIMHRAYQTVRLTRLLEDRAPCRDRDPAAINLEWRIAKGLAEALHSLRIVRDSDTVSCSEVLRDVVRDMTELFGGAACIDGISTSIERLRLVSFKRRAMVLLAGHLVVEVLLHAVRGRRGGQIVVTLDQPCRRFGRLAVGYDDQAGLFGPPDEDCGVIDDLASLLESEVAYRAGGGRIVAEVEFPLG